MRQLLLIGFCMLYAYARPRYQVSVYRTIGPLVFAVPLSIKFNNIIVAFTFFFLIVSFVNYNYELES